MTGQEMIIIRHQITIIRSLAKSAIAATVRNIGKEAVSRNDFDSGTSTNTSFFFTFFLFLVFSNSATLFFKLSDGPSRDNVCNLLWTKNNLCPTPNMTETEQESTLWFLLLLLQLKKKKNCLHFTASKFTLRFWDEISNWTILKAILQVIGIGSKF